MRRARDARRGAIAAVWLLGAAACGASCSLLAPSDQELMRPSPPGDSGSPDARRDGEASGDANADGRPFDVQTCEPDGGFCFFNTDCCGGQCNGTTCGPCALPNSSCTSMPCCAGSTCTGATCVACSLPGGRCDILPCCAGTCRGNLCR